MRIKISFDLFLICKQFGKDKYLFFENFITPMIMILAILPIAILLYIYSNDVKYVIFKRMHMNFSKVLLINFVFD